MSGTHRTFPGRGAGGVGGKRVWGRRLSHRVSATGDGGVEGRRGSARTRSGGRFTGWLYSGRLGESQRVAIQHVHVRRPVRHRGHNMILHNLG